MKKVLSCFSLFLMLVSFAPLRSELGSKIAFYNFVLDEEHSKHCNVPIPYPFIYWYGYQNNGYCSLEFRSLNNKDTSPTREYIKITADNFLIKDPHLNLVELLAAFKTLGKIQMLPKQHGVEVAQVKSDLPTEEFDQSRGNRVITLQKNILAKDPDSYCYFLEIAYRIYYDEGLSSWEKEDAIEDAREFLKTCSVLID